MLNVISACGWSETQVNVDRVIPWPVDADAAAAAVVRITTGCGRARIDIRRDSEIGESAGGGGGEGADGVDELCW